MALDLWFAADVARILASTWETMQATSSAMHPSAGNGDGSIVMGDARVAEAYRHGFEDALRAVGIAFGLTEGHISNRGYLGGGSPRVPDYPRS